MVAALQAALDDQGIDDRIEVVGEFEPKGASKAMILGGMLGSSIGGEFGNLGDAVGLGVGFAAGRRGNADGAGLPKSLVVGASATTVYGFKTARRGRNHEPEVLLFRIPRSDLEVHVKGRVNVRLMELVDTTTGAKVELEGNRLPVTHSHDLMEHLAGGAAVEAADAEAAGAGEVLDA